MIIKHETLTGYPVKQMLFKDNFQKAIRSEYHTDQTQLEIYLADMICRNQTEIIIDSKEKSQEPRFIFMGQKKMLR